MGRDDAIYECAFLTGSLSGRMAYPCNERMDITGGIPWRTGVAGGKMKEAGTIHWNSPNTGATNESGFTALPAGYRNEMGTFYEVRKYAEFWPSNDSSYYSWKTQLHYYSSGVYQTHSTKNNGYSVRCIWDNSPPSAPSDPTPEIGATDQDLSVILSWVCSDPDNDPLSFDLYFGSEPDPPLFEPGITGYSFLMDKIDYNTTYYWKIVVHDLYDFTVEGPVWNFTTKLWSCGLPLVDTRDMKFYNTVPIGEQCWMAENLNTGIRIEIFKDQDDNSMDEKYCYNNLETNCDTYGGLYQWNEMMQYSNEEGIQGICPYGWHIPAEGEWSILVNYLDGPIVAGGMLKESGTLHWNPPNTGATNVSGFTALPGGYRSSDGNNYSLKNWGFFWSSTETSTNDAWVRFMKYNSAEVDMEEDYKLTSFSVRCLKTNMPPDIPSNPSPENGAIDQPSM